MISSLGLGKMTHPWPWKSDDVTIEMVRDALEGTFHSKRGVVTHTCETETCAAVHQQ